MLFLLAAGADCFLQLLMIKFVNSLVFKIYEMQKFSDKQTIDNKVLLIFVLILCRLLFYYLLKWCCKVVYNTDWLLLIKQAVIENLDWCAFFSLLQSDTSPWGVISSPKECMALTASVQNAFLLMLESSV